MSIEVFQVGTKVKVNDVPGRIRQICIGGRQNVTYEVAWWNGRSISVEWFPEREIDGPYNEMVQVGFHAEAKA